MIESHQYKHTSAQGENVIEQRENVMPAHTLVPGPQNLSAHAYS